VAEGVGARRAGGPRPVRAPPAEGLAHDVAGHEHEVGRALGQAPHEVRVPARPERHVHAHPVAVGHELLLQVAPDAVEHLELEAVGADVLGRGVPLGLGDDGLVVRGEAG
jgi:hypothetical protein